MDPVITHTVKLVTTALLVNKIPVTVNSLMCCTFYDLPYTVLCNRFPVVYIEVEKSLLVNMLCSMCALD
jgi:hypothetical protein